MPGNTYRSNYVSYTDHTDYTGYINNYASGQIFNIIDQDRRYTLSEEAANILENLLRDKDKKCEFLLKNLLIQLVSEDKKFANLLRKYIQQSTIMETE